MQNGDWHFLWNVFLADIEGQLENSVHVTKHQEYCPELQGCGHPKELQWLFPNIAHSLTSAITTEVQAEDAKEKVVIKGRSLRPLLFCHSVIKDTNFSPNTLLHFQTSVNGQRSSLLTTRNNLLDICRNIYADVCHVSFGLINIKLIKYNSLIEKKTLWQVEI